MGRGRLGLAGRARAGTGRFAVPAEACTEPVVPARACTEAVSEPAVAYIEAAVLVRRRIGMSPVPVEGRAGTVPVQAETRIGAAPVRVAVDKTAAAVAGHAVAVLAVEYSSVLVGHRFAALGSWALSPEDNQRGCGSGNKPTVAVHKCLKSSFAGCNELSRLV